jgi:uncharacterized membrane protein
LRVAYEKTEYGLAYPLARGAIPASLAAIGWASSEALSSMQIVGVLAVLTGFVLFTFKARQLGSKDIHGAVVAMISGLLLSGAVYCDIAGIRLTDFERTTGIEYVITTTFFGSLLVIAVGEVQAVRNDLLTTMNRDGLLSFLRAFATTAFGFQHAWRIVRKDSFFFLISGSAATASFALALWAYAHGPIGLVAPLRETNILFAGILAVLYLHETVTRSQWVAIGITTMGAVIIKFY